MGLRVERLDDLVVERGAQLLDLLVLARGLDPVGEQHHRAAAAGGDPQRRAGVAEVTDALTRPEAARRRAFQRRAVPAEAPGGAGHAARSPELALDAAAGPAG